MSAQIHTILRNENTDTTPRQPCPVLLIPLMRPKQGRNTLYYISADPKRMRSKHAPGAHGRRKAKGNPSAGSSSPCCWKGSAMGEKRGKHTLPTARLTSRPPSPTAHSGLHSLHRTIIGQKDYDASISNVCWIYPRKAKATIQQTSAFDYSRPLRASY